MNVILINLRIFIKFSLRVTDTYTLTQCNAQSTNLTKEFISAETTEPGYPRDLLGATHFPDVEKKMSKNHPIDTTKQPTLRLSAKKIKIFILNYFSKICNSFLPPECVAKSPLIKNDGRGEKKHFSVQI